MPPKGRWGSGEKATIITRREFVKEMSPRNYDMSKRAAAVQETRRRIVDATRALHTEQGIAGTSWDDIAARAGVGVGTVYRHFPTLDELVPACHAASMEVVALPSAEEAPALFEDARTPAERVARLVEIVYGIYARGAPELRVVLREPDAHPNVAAARAELEASLTALVDAAGVPDRALVRAMIDLGTWDALRGAGLDQAGAVTAMSELLATRP
jgi:AcrR family transcriptional regulator